MCMSENVNDIRWLCEKARNSKAQRQRKCTWAECFPISFKVLFFIRLYLDTLSCYKRQSSSTGKWNDAVGVNRTLSSKQVGLAADYSSNLKQSFKSNAFDAIWKRFWAKVDKVWPFTKICINSMPLHCSNIQMHSNYIAKNNVSCLANIHWNKLNHKSELANNPTYNATNEAARIFLKKEKVDKKTFLTENRRLTIVHFQNIPLRLQFLNFTENLTCTLWKWASSLFWLCHQTSQYL